MLKRKISHLHLPDKRYCSPDGPGHDTVQTLTSQAHHNLAPCQGFVSTRLNHTSDNKKAC